MWELKKNLEHLYLSDGRIILFSNDTTDYNLFLLWLAEWLK